jgi:hypothetical protein
MNKDLQKNLEAIAAIKDRLLVLETEAKPLEAHLNELKFNTMVLMQKTHSKRSEAIGGWYVIRSERKSIVIADQEAIMDYIEKNDFAIDEYLTLDKDRVKAMADSALKETGELVPGVEVVVNEYLTLKKEA